MSLPTWVQGSRHTGLRLRWVRRDGTYPDLTGTTITGKLRSSAAGSSSVAMTGTLAPDTNEAAAGWFVYAPSAADVGTAGTYEVQFTATYADTKPDLTFRTEWVIEAAL
jgi:hypothetical protein